MGLRENIKLKKVFYVLIQILQSKMLRKFSKAPFYVTNETIHNDLKILFVKNSAKLSYQKYHAKALKSTCHYPRVPKLALMFLTGA